MQIYKFRIVLDNKESVFRDIEIPVDATFSELHNTILNAFDFSGTEMASFFMSNDNWDRGEEIPQFDMSEGEAKQSSMEDLKLLDRVEREGDKILYVYDFLRLWIFYLELIDISDSDPDITYPNISFSVGTAPDENSKDLDFTMETELQEDAPDDSEFEDLDPDDDGNFEDYY